MGCDSSSSDSSNDHNTKFDNESTTTVTVSPGNDETFAEFMLEAGKAKSVERVGEVIDFTFDAEAKVEFANVEDVEVIFTDPVEL